MKPESLRSAFFCGKVKLEYWELRNEDGFGISKMQ